MTRAEHLWNELRASLWFVPALIVAGSVVLAIGLIEIDTIISRDRLMAAWPKLFGAGADGSRGLLTAIASSMITVAGVTFSITVVALALASSQYSSRILRNFMQDRANQSVLGVFVGIFAYCIVVLRTIRGGDERTFVPAVSVFGAVLLAFAAIGFLIFFIHHIAVAIQATSIVSSAAAETMSAVERLYPETAGTAAERSEVDEPDLSGYSWTAVPARESGYIQLVESEALVDVARRSGSVIRMDRSMGEFVIEGSPIASISMADADDGTIADINDAFTVGRHRIVSQDAEYGIRQIVDIALKALSPGINDTTTALNCLDYLSMIFSRLVLRRVESPFKSDGDDLRVIARGPDFPELLAGALDPIRRNAEGNVDVMMRLLRVIEIVAAVTDDERRLGALRQQGDLVVAMSERTVAEAGARNLVLLARARVKQTAN